MDPASRQQALVSALLGEVENLQKQVLSLAGSVASVAEEVRKNAVQNKQDLAELAARIDAKKSLEVKMQAPEVKVNAKGLVANLLSLFRRKK